MFAGTWHEHNNYVWEQKATDGNQKCSKMNIVSCYFLSKVRLREFTEPSEGAEIDCLSARHSNAPLSSHRVHKAVRTHLTHEMRLLEQGNT